MITCPICGGETRIKGRYGDCGTDYRMRKCVDCGHKIYTEETEAKGAQAEYYKGKHKYVKEYKQKRSMQRAKK